MLNYRNIKVDTRQMQLKAICRCQLCSHSSYCSSILIIPQVCVSVCVLWSGRTNTTAVYQSHNQVEIYSSICVEYTEYKICGTCFGPTFMNANPANLEPQCVDQPCSQDFPTCEQKIGKKERVVESCKIYNVRNITGRENLITCG